RSTQRRGDALRRRCRRSSSSNGSRRRSAVWGSQSQGIQQLLQAEKRAAEKVAEARKRKNRRLKQAKEEAQAEIEQYRLQREKEFKAKEAAALGSHGSCTTEVEKETQEKMSVIQQNFQKNREVVLSQLLSLGLLVLIARGVDAKISAPTSFLLNEVCGVCAAGSLRGQGGEETKPDLMSVCKRAQRFACPGWGCEPGLSERQRRD
uniref:ATPase H+ transporting V1 subunit G1 n=1 Tax=Anas zonorhyncha TaxID=75864 RepID=A0A8B9UNG9_9AVES